MSDATYSIEIRHDPHPEAMYPWSAYITRISDNDLQVVRSANSRDEALSRARAWIAEEALRQPSDTLYVGDDGQDAEVPL